MSENPSPVRIKGLGNRLWVSVDPQTPFDTIQTELTRLFDPYKNQARGARVILDFGEQGAAEDLFETVGRYLKETYALDAVEAPPQKKPTSEKQTAMEGDWRDMISRRPGDTLVMAGRVRSGQTVTAKNHLIILGDVNPGSEIIAGGDILVLGSLCGTAAAGQPNNTEAIILALDFRPIQLKIGPMVAAGLPESGSAKPEFAHIEEGAIVVDDYLTANPFKTLSWPVAR